MSGKTLGDDKVGVDVTWKDADGLQLDHVSDAPGWFARALDGSQNPPRSDLPIMRSIDLYGASIVIAPQTDSLAAELEKVRGETTEVEARLHLGS